MKLTHAAIVLLAIAMLLASVVTMDVRWALAAPLVFVALALISSLAGQAAERRAARKAETAEEAEVRRLIGSKRGQVMPHTPPTTTLLVPADHPAWTEAAQVDRRPVPCRHATLAESRACPHKNGHS